MGGELLFWIFIVIFTIVMFALLFFMDRPKKSRGITTRMAGRTDAADPRGRHRLADKVDLGETDSRL